MSHSESSIYYFCEIGEVDEVQISVTFREIGEVQLSVVIWEEDFFYSCLGTFVILII